MYLALILLLFTINLSYSESGRDSARIYGVTIDDISNLDEIVESLERLPVKPTVRIVFDEWIPAEQYIEAVDRIGKMSNIMGELLDSYYMKEYSYKQYRDRIKNYLDVLGNKVDIWEVGNEANGEWLGNSDYVWKKIEIACRLVKEKKMKTALTLYYNEDCWEKPENEMFTWVNNNIPDDIKKYLDYVFVSYYEDDCNELQPDWQPVFDSLHVLFPGSYLGIGECGTKYKDKKEKYIKRYYNMNINTPDYVGGYFWWYFRQDCVPHTKNLWKILYSVLKKTK
jgi:hypothetical protein